MSKSIARKATTGLLALAMTSGLGLGLASTAAAAPATGGSVATHGKGVVRWIKSPDGFANVRSGPGTGFKVLRKLSSCTKVTVVETKGGWSRLADGGWVANWLLSGTPCGKPDKPLPPTGGCPGWNKPCQKPCGPPAPKCLWRVVVSPKRNTEADARALAAKIGGGAFIRNIGTAAKPNWVVQVGAFAVRANADARAAQFKWGARVLDCA